jgi:hypothetical protein
LATQASAEFAARSLGGRHPVWVFLVAPIPAVVLLLALGIGGVAVAVEYTPASWANFITRNNGQELLLEMGCWVARILPFAVIAHLFARAAVRSGRSGLWGLLAGALVSAIALSFAVHYRLPTGGPGTGMLSVGLGFPPTDSVQWLQCLVPMGIVLGHLAPNTRPFRDHENLA